MVNDLTGFAAVPGAEQERFQQLFEAASDKFRRRFESDSFIANNITNQTS